MVGPQPGRPALAAHRGHGCSSARECPHRTPPRDAWPGSARPRAATHAGPFDRLEDATGQFLSRASERGVVFDTRHSDQGEVWGARLEHYLTDAGAEPDPRRWETVLEFRLRD